MSASESVNFLAVFGSFVEPYSEVLVSAALSGVAEVCCLLICTHAERPPARTRERVLLAMHERALPCLVTELARERLNLDYLPHGLYGSTPWREQEARIESSRSRRIAMAASGECRLDAIDDPSTP